MRLRLESIAQVRAAQGRTMLALAPASDLPWLPSLPGERLPSLLPWRPSVKATKATYLRSSVTKIGAGDRLIKCKSGG